MRNFVDNQLAHYFNHFVHRYQTLDAFVYQVAQGHLFKGAVLLSIITFAWFKVDMIDNAIKKRKFLMVIIAAIVAMIIARFLALCLPFRYRPLHDPDLQLQASFSVQQWELNGWSSFPSDHMALFFAISLSIYFIHKQLGRVALLYTAIFIGIPRLLLGFHFFTDELVGMMIGCFSAWLGYSYMLHSKAMDKLIEFQEQKPAYFYPLLVLFISQLYEMFESARDLFKLLIKALLLA